MVVASLVAVTAPDKLGGAPDGDALSLLTAEDVEWGEFVLSPLVDGRSDGELLPETLAEALPSRKVVALAETVSTADSVVLRDGAGEEEDEGDGAFDRDGMLLRVGATPVAVNTGVTDVTALALGGTAVGEERVLGVPRSVPVAPTPVEVPPLELEPPKPGDTEGLLLNEPTCRLAEAPKVELADAVKLPPPPSAPVRVAARLAVSAACREGLTELLRDASSTDAVKNAETEAAVLREADGDGVSEATPGVAEAQPLPDLRAELVTEGDGVLDNEARPERVAEGEVDADAHVEGVPDAMADAEAVAGARLGLATDELVPPSACAEGVFAPEKVGAPLKVVVAVAQAVLLMNAEAVPQALPEAVALSNALAVGSSGVPLGDLEARGEAEAEGVVAGDSEDEGEGEARGVPVPPLPADSVAAAAVGVGAVVMEWARPLVVGAGETVGSAPEGLGGTDPLL